MYSHYIPYLKSQLKLGSYLNCHPYIYDDKTGTLLVNNSKITGAIIRLDNTIFVSYLAFQLLQLLGDHSMAEKLQSVLFCLAFMMPLVPRWDLDPNHPDVALINDMLSHERKQEQKRRRDFSNREKSNNAKLLIILQQLCTLTCVIFPIIMGFTVYASSCIPPFLGSFIVPKVYGSCSAPPPMMRLSLALFEWNAYSKSLIYGTIKCVWFLLPGIVYIVDNLKRMENGSRDRSNWIREYRRLQIMNGLINSSMRHSTTVLLLGIALIQLHAGFLSIKLREYIDWPFFMVFPMAVIDGFVGNIICASAGGMVFGKSKQIIRSQKQRIVRGKLEGRAVRYRLRQLKACAELRMEFGRNNFIDETTPLVIQQFCLNNLVNLLVLFK